MYYIEDRSITPPLWAGGGMGIRQCHGDSTSKFEKLIPVNIPVQKAGPFAPIPQSPDPLAIPSLVPVQPGHEKHRNDTSVPPRNYHQCQDWIRCTHAHTQTFLAID
jgi:hypothetical protein